MKSHFHMLNNLSKAMYKEYIVHPLIQLEKLYKVNNYPQSYSINNSKNTFHRFLQKHNKLLHNDYNSIRKNKKHTLHHKSCIYYFHNKIHINKYHKHFLHNSKHKITYKFHMYFLMFYIFLNYKLYKLLGISIKYTIQDIFSILRHY